MMTVDSWLLLGVVHAALLLLHDLIVYVAPKAMGRVKRLLGALWHAYRTDYTPVRIPIRYEPPGHLFDIGVVFVLCGLGVANLLV